MSIRNHLKSTLLAVTAAATLLLALPSQAGDHRDRDGGRESYGWQAGSHRDSYHHRHDRHDHRDYHRHSRYRYPPRHAGYHAGYHQGYRDGGHGRYHDDHRHGDWHRHDHRGQR